MAKHHHKQVTIIREQRLPMLLWVLLSILLLTTGYLSYHVQELREDVATDHTLAALPTATAHPQECTFTDGNLTIHGCPMVQQYVDEIIKQAQGQRIWTFEADCQIESVSANGHRMKCTPTDRS